MSLVAVRPHLTEVIGGDEGGYSPGVEAGNVISLMCRTSGARPAAIITWYNGSLPFNEQPAGKIALKVRLLII